ncbi:hypothetical protein P4O66_016000 [Electrophorus voltai]|uniref:BTB domain-containing protein n=1 Tax=Electrophorus voltai TaxID=2609070 RepID=A0AAD8YWS6_9TELE|nr:hypothetical protein P4O66_016000 [Electrophorus voltai]
MLSSCSALLHRSPVVERAGMDYPVHRGDTLSMGLHDRAECGQTGRTDRPTDRQTDGQPGVGQEVAGPGLSSQRRALSCAPWSLNVLRGVRAASLPGPPNNILASAATFHEAAGRAPYRPSPPQRFRSGAERHGSPRWKPVRGIALRRLSPELLTIKHAFEMEKRFPRQLEISRPRPENVQVLSAIASIHRDTGRQKATGVDRARETSFLHTRTQFTAVSRLLSFFNSFAHPPLSASLCRSLVEDDDAHMKVSLGCGEMGLSAHLQASKTGNTRFFTSNTHSSVVLQGFDQLRIEGLLCDVTLVAGDGDEAFPVHRAMMASSSDYFKAMFTGGMKEQDLMCIKLHGVNRIGLKKIIDFIYTAKLSLNMENLQDTLEAASFLQILPVLDFCKVFLISGVSLENCVEVGRIANAYNLTEVDKYVNNFILKNFPSLLGTGEFVKLPFERLAFVLASNSLKHCGELELFKAACRWLRHEDGRMEGAAKLMRNIRFPLMSPADLINHVQTVDFMRTDNACVNLLLEASNYQMMPYMQPVMQSERTAIRSDNAHLVTLGGVLRQQLVVSKELRLFDEKAHEWKALAPMDAPRYQHGIAVIGNFLYVVGGQSNYDTKGKTAVDTVFRYDPRYNRWMQVACLNEKRTFFHLSALKGYLYAVGGRNAAGELATVECYNPRTNEWTYVAKMNEPHYGHAGTVYGGYMYISDGLDWLQLLRLSSLPEAQLSVLVNHYRQDILPERDRKKEKPLCGITHDTFQKELMCFDPDADKWSQKAPMTTVRGLHCMCTVGDRLYVIGGNHFRGTSDYDDVLSCEYYSPALDAWTPIAAMLRGQSDVGVAVFESKIYVVGGYSWNNRCMVEIVQKYDPERDEWHKVFDLPESLGGIRACTLTVFPPDELALGGSPGRESPLAAP